MKKEVKLGDQTVIFESSGDIPRMYRRTFGKDILVQMTAFQQRATKKEEFTPDDIEMFENLAWTYAAHADPNIADIDTWLRQFGPMDILNNIDAIIGMWLVEIKTTSKAKKKNDKPTEK